MSQRKRKRADEVKEEQIELVKELLDEREQAIAHHRPHFSQRQIANIVSKTTGSSISQQSVSRYSSQDMSIEAREEREKHRQWNQKLELWQKNEVAGMVFFGNLFHKNVDTQIVMSYIWKRFEVHVSPDWVSDWMVAMHLSSRKVRYASASEMNQQTYDDMISFQESIKYLTEIQKVGPEQIYFVDKMYVGDKPKHGVNNIGPKGLCESHYLCQL